MAETRKTDEDRLIEQTLLLFQNAIAEGADSVAPPVHFDHAATAKDPPAPKPPEKRPPSLIGDIVAFAKTVSGFDSTPAQTARSSFQPLAAETGWEEPVDNLRFDVFEAARPPSPNATDAAAAWPQQPIDKPVSRSAPPSERPNQEGPRAPTDHVASSQNARHTAEKPVGGERSGLAVDRPLPMLPIAAIDEPKPVGATPPAWQRTAEAKAPLRQLPVDKPASENALPLERRPQEKSPAPVDLALPPSVDKTAAKLPVGDERSVPLIDRPVSMVATVPIGKTNIVEATPPPSPGRAEVAAASIPQPVDKPGSRTLGFEHPAPEKPGITIENAHSLVIKKVVVSAQRTVEVKQLLVSEPESAQIARTSLQPDVKPGPEKPALDARSDPLIDQALSMIAKPDAVGIAPPFSVSTADAVEPLRDPADGPASRDTLPLARPGKKELPSLIDHALSLVKDVAAPDRDTVLARKDVISQFSGVNAAPPSSHPRVDKPALETPAPVPRPAPLVDRKPSVSAIAHIGEPGAVGTASPPSPNTAEAKSPSPRPQVDRPAAADLLRSSERPAQEKPLSSLDQSHPAAGKSASAAPKTESAISLPQQPPIKEFSQLSPEERLDAELADIRRRVAAFKENQQRFQQKREEYFASTMAKARDNPVTSDRDSK